MSDFYKECMVRKVLTAKERFTRALIWGAISFALVALAVWGLVFLNPIGRILLLVAVAVLVLDKFYWNKFLYKLSSCIEYEYTLTNTTLDVDKILAKTERTRLLSFDLKEITLMSRLDMVTNYEYDGQFRTICDAAEDIADLKSTWCILAETDRYGRLRLTFTPNEAMLELFDPLLGRKFRKCK